MDEYEQNRWRKRPVEITARRMREPFEVETMEGVMKGKAGDWLITGVKGEQYPCDDEIFRATYRPSEETASEEDTDAPTHWIMVDRDVGPVNVTDSERTADRWRRAGETVIPVRSLDRATAGDGGE